jgi:uncharacterized protein
MDLRKRLANLDRLSKRNKMQTANSNEAAAVDFETIEQSLFQLQLKSCSASSPPVWTREYCEKFSFPWGNFPPLEGFFTRAGEASPHLEEILFLDTETTGLAGGTGTIAFLVGVGWFRNKEYHSLQYFLPDFAHEQAMLVDLAVLSEKFKVVMTFNGASFDLPLLRTRALMNRMPDPCGSLVSWDLLVPGRRLWGRVFTNCRQQTLENGLLNVQRGPGDIDGALIPQTWFDFLKTGDGEMMSRVLHHNQKDLVGMAGIFAHVLDKARCLKDYDPPLGQWKDAWALGKIAEKARLQDFAAVWMQRAATASTNNAEGGFADPRFVADAIRLMKRQGNWLQVQAVIDNAFESGRDEPWLHREAAILYEHRLFCLPRALAHARQCDEPQRVLRLENKIQKIKG